MQYTACGIDILPKCCVDAEFFFFGLKRSGNHPVILFILDHFLNCQFFNSCRYPIRGVMYIDDPRERHCRYTVNGSGKGTSRLFSFENKWVESDFMRNIGVLSLARGGAKESKGVVILRDPYNWIASYLKNCVVGGMERMIVDLWKYYAKTFFVSRVDGVFAVNFNLWFTCEEYRKKLSRFIGRPYVQTSLNVVGDFGGGSSFSGLEYDGRGRKLEVLERWKAVDMAVLKNWVDDEMAELSEEIFGFRL